MSHYQSSEPTGRPTMAISALSQEKLIEASGIP
jgi:hypothetical protein